MFTHDIMYPYTEYVSASVSFFTFTFFLDELSRFLPIVSKVMNQLTQIATSYKWTEEGDFIPGMVNKFIVNLNSLVKHNKEQAERVSTCIYINCCFIIYIFIILIVHINVDTGMFIFLSPRCCRLWNRLSDPSWTVTTEIIWLKIATPISCQIS